MLVNHKSHSPCCIYLYLCSMISDYITIVDHVYIQILLDISFHHVLCYVVTEILNSIAAALKSFINFMFCFPNLETWLYTRCISDLSLV